MKLITNVVIIFLLTIFMLNCKNKTYYKDGIYSGKSKSIYTDENFWGSVKLVVKNGEITEVNFCIIDSTNHEIFDPNYENHYIGNDLYIQQCKDNWQGIIRYPEKLIQTQDIDNVDIISGATWSYNMLKHSTIEALRDAKTQ